jgi:hypothetical protein
MAGETPKSELSAAQQTVLDLALACDLQISDPEQATVLQDRHKSLKTQADAAAYISHVETKIHGNRKWQHEALMPIPPLASSNPDLTRLAAAAQPVSLLKSSTTKPAPIDRLNIYQHSMVIFLLTGFMVIAGLFAGSGLNLVLVTLLILLIMGVLGNAITKRPLGILINERNLMSLSRFQMAIWTAVVLGAYFTFALVRIRHGENNPLNITIDKNLWWVLGISTTSLVGAPFILSTKKDKTPAPSVAPKISALVGESPDDINTNRQGTLYANENISDALVTDMFQGDELINTAQIDLAKVQMFFFTIIAAISFFVMAYDMLVTKSTLDTLPLLPEGLIALLGISHGGYLTSKSINQTQSSP